MSKYGGPSETAIMREIQVALSSRHGRLWRFQCGEFTLSDGRHITVGVPGMSDLIGLNSVVITPEMVGQRVAIFCAVEVKRPDVKARPAHQVQFVEAVKTLGGRAGFASSIEEASAIIAV